MVGSFTDSSNVEHGFFRNNGTFTEINYPGAANTALSDVNENNEVTGAAYDSSYSTYHGFVWVSGRFQSISDPGDPHHTALNGINNVRVLVGNRDNSGTGF